jgi:uncharacterized cupin superfamily protein
VKSLTLNSKAWSDTLDASVANIFEPDWTFEGLDQAPWFGRGARVGAQSGAERLGATVYEVAPGGRISPLHVHHANEELIIVLSGGPTLRTPEGTRELEPGEVVACPPGRRGAHRVENASERPVRVLIVSTMVFPDVVEHLDSEKVLVLTAPPDDAGTEDLLLAFRRDDAVPPATGEIAT